MVNGTPQPPIVRVELPTSMAMPRPMPQNGAALLTARVLLPATYLYRADVRWQALFYTSTGPNAPGSCDGGLVRLWADDGLDHKALGANDGFQTVPPDRWTLVWGNGVFPAFYSGGSSVTFTLRALGGGCATMLVGHEAVPRNVPEGSPVTRQKTFIEVIMTGVPR